MLLNQLSEIAPAGAVIAAVAWGTLSYVVTGPELAARISNADYVQDCKANLATSIAESFEQELQTAGRPSAAEQQSAAVAPYIDQMYQQYGDQMAVLDAITGGAYSAGLEVTRNAARDAQQIRDQAAAALLAQRERAVATAPDQCSCQVVAALTETRTDWAIFAGTLGFIEQDGVSSFPSMMRAHARMCAERTIS